MKIAMRIFLAFVAIIFLYSGYLLHFSLLIGIGGIAAFVLVVWLILENEEYEDQLKNK